MLIINAKHIADTTNFELLFEFNNRGSPPEFFLFLITSFYSLKILSFVREQLV